MARPTLAQLGVTETMSGVGVHLTPACEGDPFQDPAQAAEFVAMLWAHGISVVKTFGSTTKQEIARQAALRGMLPVHRWWRGHRIGAPDYCTPDGEIAQYVNAGCKIQELHNEPNLADEWDDGPYHGLPPRDQIANILWTDWLKFADNCNRTGAYACFPAMSPGGDIEHRTLLNMLLEYGAQHNFLGRITDNVIAQHPRGLNIEIDCLHSDVMTCTFDEYRHTIETFKAAGVDTWHLATEHGWSWGNQGDWARPPVDEPFWYDNNREAFLRMNPGHAKPILPEMLALFYWVQGDPTDWPADSIDQARFGIPTPSRLWIDMGQHPEWYRWNRYGSTPPVVDHAKGFDCSQYQGDINWNAVSGDFSFVFIRASVGDGPDAKYAQNFDGAGGVGLLRGVYHYLRQEFDGQARLFYETVGDRTPELGYYGDIEQAALTGDKCALFLATLDGFTGKPTGIYTRANIFDKFGTPAWAQGRKLWIAHWNVAAPTLPRAWSTWEWWQTGQGQVAGKVMDLNEYNGDVGALFDNYGPEDDPPEEGDVLVFDKDGNEKDWPWVEATYGDVQILGSDGDHYSIVQLNESEGIMAFRCTLLNEAGGPVAGQQVAYIWPDGEQIEVTNSLGVAEHVAGPGEGYWYPGPGPISWKVRGAESDLIGGLGWLNGTNHCHLQVTMQWNGGGDEPPEPPTDFEADTTARLERIEAKIDALGASMWKGGDTEPE